MPNRLLPLLLTVFLLGSPGEVFPFETRPAKPSADSLAAAKSNNKFAVDLYGKLSAERPGNLCFSPYSISTALAMTYAGARGETETEMAKALHLTLPKQRLHPAFATLRAHIDVGRRLGSHHLDVANRLWGQQGYVFLPEFLRITGKYYGAELAQVDFAGNTEDARQTINAWVHKETQQKIAELIPRRVLRPSCRLVLTNAVYLKANWASPFDVRNTQNAPFHISAKKKIDVPMMRQQEWCKYCETTKLQILEFPYRGNELSMLVLLPKEIEGLAELEKSLADAGPALATPVGPDEFVPSAAFAAIRKPPTEGFKCPGLYWRELIIYLPKFKITAHFPLEKVLQSMGMNSAFLVGKADFSGMTTKESLFLSAVVHKTFVDVNEVGTEAAAATMAGADPFAPPAVFRADHPFLFLIRHNRTGAILFLGRVANPKG